MSQRRSLTSSSKKKMVIACMQAMSTEHVNLASISEGTLGPLHLHYPMACTYAVVVGSVFIASVYPVDICACIILE